MKLDMHCHSTNSDGGSREQDLLLKAKDLGIDFMFLTDHDRVIDSFCEQAKDFGIKTCPSVEISSYSAEHNKRLHLTFYAKQISGEIYDILENTVNSRIGFIQSQIEVLQNAGFFININDFYSFYLNENRNPDSLNRYDIVRYMFLNQYNRNLAKKINLNIDIDFTSFYRKYLKEGGSHSELFLAVVPKYEPNLEVVKTLRESNNAILSIAHPNFTFRSIEEYKKVLPDYVLSGVNAVEINSRANLAWVTAILESSHDHDLFLTFGSDCHSIGNPDESHGDLGELNPFISERFQGKKFNAYRDLLGL
ncbi:MAG: PHP domain-containing protein [Candidatus Gracilibacteria bacterium]|nr:PHP domain-containing protein [Candidatus Gracilibacteria bacterium]